MRRVVVLGAGFGGLRAILDLERQYRRRIDVEMILVSDQNFMLFTPLLPQIASSFTNPRHIVQAVRDIRGKRRFRFRRDTVRAIDLRARRVELLDGSLDYDTLVIALGSRSDYFGIPGTAEHTLNFKSLEDSVIFREHVIDCLEHADHIEDPAERRRLLTFAVVGGGYTGVELISELHDFMFGYVTNHYRGISASEIRLVLIEAAPDILRGVHPKLAEHSRRRLQKQGVKIRFRARVTQCFPDGIEINNTEILSSATVAWSAGVRAVELVETLPGPHDRIGRAIVNDHLQLEGHPEVFVVGDSCAPLSTKDAPRVAPVAIAEGRIAARNIVHQERGEPLESYVYVSKGVLISLGMNHAVVSIAGLQFGGYFAWLFWNAVHLYKLVGLKKQIQVALDWVLGVIFPRDASIVRRPVGCKLCGTVPAKSRGA
ncbi:MAG TPA: NAD(P)/FAD-dependent oxidoreductase [Candidatus Dormibacteraeota bacterium]|nr:NAD(P)/FAD-dependent oxidoreductase [Candidatus Dormibacteraeota bacterium]